MGLESSKNKTLIMIETIKNRNTAYKNLKLSKKRQYVYDMIEALGKASPQYLCAEYPMLKINSIVGRFTELRESGHIKILYHSTNPSTGQKNAWYGITTKDERINIINKKYQSLVDKKSNLERDWVFGSLQLSGITRDMIQKEINKIDLQIKNLIP
jgi:hypothetical protein